MASFTIITNLTNGAGLQRDYLLMRERLEALGHTVTGEMFNAANPTFRHCDVNIFLEVVRPEHMRFARKNWVVPNSEWWFDCWDPCLRAMDLVLCKTPDCFDIWQRKVGAKAVYTGWEANDFYRPEINKRPSFIHFSRNSENKGTEFIMQAWRKYALPYPLLTVGRKDGVVQQCQGIANVTHRTELPEEDFINAMNSFLFHLAPTRYEGFGMWIHEALGCGGVVLTTDAPPMNQFSGVAPELLIPVARSVPRLIAKFNFVSPEAVAEAVHAAAALPATRIAEISAAARAAFLADNDFFRGMITSLTECL